jgi:hypothetical protein
MGREDRYRFLEVLEEAFEVCVSDQEAISASTSMGLARLIVDKLRREGKTFAVAKARSFLLLRRAMAGIFRIPQSAIRPSSRWAGYLPQQKPRTCQHFWRLLRTEVSGRLPSLRGPRWPWTVFDFLIIPMAPLCYVACGGGTRGIAYGLAILLVPGLLAFALGRVLANCPPHKTVDDSAKCLAEAEGERSDSGDSDGLVSETELIVREIVGAELAGEAFDDEIPFRKLSESSV